MSIGPIVAVRDESPAARAGVRIQSGSEPADVLTGVELPQPGGGTLRYTLSPSAKPEPGVEERHLDPVRLPDDLDRWAAAAGDGPKTVTLILQRPKGHSERGVTEKLAVDWDDRWRLVHSTPINPNSPVALDCIGLAYAVSTAVGAVEPDSPAAAAGLEKDDVVKAIQFFRRSSGGGLVPDGWQDLGLDQWPSAHYAAQHRADARKIGLRVQRKDQVHDVVLEGTDDVTWPMAERGLRFAADRRLQTASSLGESLALGMKRTHRTIVQIYQNLLAMIDGRISFPKNASGPLTIAAVSYDIAGESLERFILFLGMISINLAVINFLPIPVLDGGHMVFLIYEKLRGRPAPEQLRFAATFLGIALIGSLMLFVIYLDVKRLMF
jgi:regulator of sigma E protease